MGHIEFQELLKDDLNRNILDKRHKAIAKAGNDVLQEEPISATEVLDVP